MFGGGVTGDLGGVLAASYLRGIEFIQVPSTLLAMVDSSVGGEDWYQSIGREKFGRCFSPTEESLIDLDVLRTLPDREFSAGWLKLSNTVCLEILLFIKS